MNGAPKPLAALAVTALLALGLAACGGSGSSTSTSTEAQAQAEGRSSGSSHTASKGGEEREGKSGAGAGEGETGAKKQSGGSTSEFAPKPHNDSGGGSKQFEVKGGDNSVQEFGGEASASELDKAATALHNFLDARAEGNWAATCTYMSKSVVESFEKLAAQSKQLGGASCAAILEKLTNPAARQSMKAEAEKANVRSLRTEGEQAFVIYTAIGSAILAMPMANEDGDWKVASLAGTPLN